MGVIVSVFNFLIVLVVMVSIISKAKRKKFYRISKPKMIKPVKGKTIDFMSAYSSKNKECHEDEVKVSSNDKKPQRRKSLWNEPSWDDELYSKK